MNDTINVKFKEFRKSVRMGQTLDLLLNFVKDVEFNDIKQKLERIKKEKNESPELLHLICKVEERKKL